MSKVKFKVHSERPYLQPEELFYLKSGYFRTAAEATRAMRDMEELQDGLQLKEKSRLEPEQQEPVTMLEVKECQCTPDAEILRELSDLRDEVERLKLIAAATQAFSYKHRHQIGDGHYSEWGIAD